jgi:hypothetical protein
MILLHFVPDWMALAPKTSNALVRTRRPYQGSCGKSRQSYLLQDLIHVSAITLLRQRGSVPIEAAK